MPTTVKLQFRAENLDRKDFFGFGKSDPYLVVKQKSEESQKLIYRTSHLKQNSSPEWAPFYVNFEDENPELKFEVYDRDMIDKQDDLIGEFEASLNELLKNHAGERRFDCINLKKKTDEKKAGVLYLKYCRKAIGVQLKFSVELPTKWLSFHKYFAKISENEEEIFKSEKVGWNSAAPVEWKVMNTGIENINNTLKVEVFKFHKHCAPELVGNFELAAIHETKFCNKIFQLNQNGKSTGTVKLKICHISEEDLTPVCLPSSSIPLPPPPPPLQLGPLDNQQKLSSHSSAPLSLVPERDDKTFQKQLSNAMLKPVDNRVNSALLNPSQALEKELLRRRASIGVREVEEDSEEWDQEDE